MASDRNCEPQGKGSPEDGVGANRLRNESGNVLAAPDAILNAGGSKDADWRTAVINEVYKVGQAPGNGDAELFIQREVHGKGSTLSTAERSESQHLGEKATENDKADAKKILDDFINRAKDHPGRDLTVIDPIEPKFRYRKNEASYPEKPEISDLSQVEQVVFKQLRDLGYRPELKGYDGGFTYRMRVRT